MFVNLAIKVCYLILGLEIFWLIICFLTAKGISILISNEYFEYVFKL